MAENPLKALETLDPDLLKLVTEGRQTAIDDGALPKKIKLLLVMALDAAHGAEGGVAAMARAAMQAGATKQEIAEVLRVLHFVCGAGCIFTASLGLKGIVD
jgi:alkylhydroperoxidase/carboxymuconolactone decarboxylase family protein YurZ